MFNKTILFASTMLLLTACGTENDEPEQGAVEEPSDETSGNDDIQTIIVASNTVPMTTIVEMTNDIIEDGYEVELLEVADDVQYNEAVNNEEADASFAQHEPFMAQFNEQAGGNLVALQPIYNAIVGFYSLDHETIEDVPEGAEIAIPSDPSNEARALLILDDHGYITLDEEAGYFATVDDIVDNPNNYQFTHVGLQNLNASYEDGYDLVFNYPTFIEQVGLTPADSVLLEADPDNTFGIQLVAREDNQDSPEIQALIAAFTSQEVYDFLEDLAAAGHLEPAFEPEE